MQSGAGGGEGGGCVWASMYCQRSVAEFVNRLAGVDTTNGLGEQMVDRENSELAEELAIGRHGVCDDEAVERTALDLLDGVTAQDRMRTGSGHREGSVLLEEGGSFVQGSATRDLVVEHEAVLPLHVSDEIGRDGMFAVVETTLVDDGHRELESFRERAGLLGMAGIGRDDDVIRQILRPPELGHDAQCLQAIRRNPEEALDLGRVQIHGQNSVRAGGLDQIGHESSCDRDPRLVLLVASGVGEVGKYSSDAASRCVLQRIEHDEELHDPLVDRRRASLNHVDIGFSDVVQNLDEQVLVRELDGTGSADRDVEMVADSCDEFGVATTTENHDPCAVQSILLSSTPPESGPYVHKTTLPRVVLSKDHA